MLPTENWSATDRAAVREMANGGELYVYISAGDYCQNPPIVGSGCILGDNGPTHVSRRTVRRLRQVGLDRGFPAQMRADRKAWAILIADGLNVELPEQTY